MSKKKERPIKNGETTTITFDELIKEIKDESKK